MKVLHVITGLGRGGAESMLVRKLGASAESGLFPAVASMTGRGVHADTIEAQGVPVYDLGMRPSVPDPLGLLRLRRIIREFDPDVIHGWMYHGALLALLAAQGRPVIVSIRHSLYDISREKFLTQRVIRALASVSSKAGCILYNSHVSRAQHERVGYCARSSLIISNGFDPKIFKPDSALRAEMRRALRIDESKFVVLHAARFHPMKDHASFLMAAQRLWADERFVFMLAGTDVTADNPELAAPLRSAPPKRVRLLGEHDDVRQLMAAADIFCLSSAWGEAFPNVLGEAMACGLPCVTTDVGDAAHIVKDTGIVVPPRDSEAIVSAIGRLAGLNNVEREALAQKARARIVKNFSLERIVAAYKDVYSIAVQRNFQRNFLP